MKRNIIATLMLMPIASVFLIGCSADRSTKFNTEIYCPKSFERFLILQVTKQDVRKSIIDAMQEQRGKAKNRYTLLSFPKNRTTSIRKISAKTLMYECILIELPRGVEY
ncbi:MAG: hypothetical protein ACJAW3_000618 [Lentimonas sp.]|jgi:hypothetical protein